MILYTIHKYITSYLKKMHTTKTETLENAGMSEYNLLITGGIIVDPANGRHERGDLAISGCQVAAFEPDIHAGPGTEIINVDGAWVLPGLVDPHVHVSSKPQGYRMMARAGVTSALDMNGRPEEIIKGIKMAGAGLTIGVLYPVVPGDTVETSDPGQSEIAGVIARAVESGALGVKILGGHIPLSPDATARVIQAAREQGAWCAVHAGSLATGSNIEGLEELVMLADGLPVHIAHVNSYCRGQITGNPVEEASRALKVLSHAPASFSESYLSLLNGTNAVMENGIPRSHVTRTCLKAGDFQATDAGMEQAIADGWAHIHGVQDDEIVLLPPSEGLEHYRARGSNVYVSFAVNSPGAAIALALARTNGEFAIPALSTDGGGIPRNTTLQQGVALVRFGALSLDDLVRKASFNPAQMLGLTTKGHLGAGADADVIVVNPATGRAEWVIANGQIIVRKGRIVGQGGRVFTTEAGQKSIASQGMESRVVAPEWLSK